MLCWRVVVWSPNVWTKSVPLRSEIAVCFACMWCVSVIEPEHGACCFLTGIELVRNLPPVFCHRVFLLRLVFSPVQCLVLSCVALRVVCFVLRVVSCWPSHCGPLYLARGRVLGPPWTHFAAVAEPHGSLLCSMLCLALRCAARLAAWLAARLGALLCSAPLLCSLRRGPTRWHHADWSMDSEKSLSWSAPTSKAATSKVQCWHWPIHWVVNWKVTNLGASDTCWERRPACHGQRPGRKCLES